MITEIMKTSNGSIGDALISKDGQWILFTLSVYKYGNEQTEVQMIRVDGRDLQTIYCTSGEFTAPQWSDDQKWLIFTTARYSHSAMKVVYLLNLTSGVLQPELFPEPGYRRLDEPMMLHRALGETFCRHLFCRRLSCNQRSRIRKI